LITKRKIIKKYRAIIIWKQFI